MLELYTDGSVTKNPGAGGWAMVVYEGGEEIHYETGCDWMTTNNRMEFEGIYAALAYLNGREGVIFSDSQYCINCLTKWWPKWQKNGWRLGKKGQSREVANVDQIKQCLKELGAARFQWVRGHTGNKGNERADELAGIARYSL